MPAYHPHCLPLFIGMGVNSLLQEPIRGPGPLGLPSKKAVNEVGLEARAEL